MQETEDVLAIRDEYRLQEWSQIIQAGQNSGLLLLKKNSDRVQRAYYLDRDLDKALRRMALEEGKNLAESVNNALRAGLTKYL